MGSKRPTLKLQTQVSMQVHFMEVGTKTPRIFVEVSVGPYLLWTGSRQQCEAVRSGQSPSLADPTTGPVNDGEPVRQTLQVPWSPHRRDSYYGSIQLRVHELCFPTCQAQGCVRRVKRCPRPRGRHNLTVTQMNGMLSLRSPSSTGKHRRWNSQGPLEGFTLPAYIHRHLGPWARGH